MSDDQFLMRLKEELLMKELEATIARMDYQIACRIIEKNAAGSLPSVR